MKKFVGLFLLFPLLTHGTDTAAPLDARKMLEEQNVQWQALAKDSTALERQRQELHAAIAAMTAKLQNLSVSQVTEAMVIQARLDSKTLKLREDEIIADNTNTTQQITNLEQTIQKLQAQEQLLRNPATMATTGEELIEQLNLTQEALAQKQTTLKLINQHLTISQEWLHLIQKKRVVVEQWQTKVEEYYRAQQEQNRQQAQQDLSTQLSRTRQTLLERADESRQRLKESGEQMGDMRRLLLDINTQSAEEQAKLISLDEQIAKTASMLARWKDLSENLRISPPTLQENLLQLKSISKITDDARNLLERRYQLFAQQREPLMQSRDLPNTEENARREVLAVINELLTAIVTRRERLNQQIAHLEAMTQQLNNAYQTRVKDNLLTSQPWPQSWDEWMNVSTGLFTAPTAIWHQIILSVEATFKQAATAAWMQWLLLVISELLLTLALFVGHRWLLRVEERNITQKISHTPWRMILRLLRWNISYIVVAAMFIAIPWWLQAPGPSLAIIATLALIGPLIKIHINFLWLLWADPILPRVRRLPKLQRQRMIGLLASIDLLGAITLLSHLTALQGAIIAVIDWLFMSYWTISFWPLSRMRHAVFAYLDHSLPDGFVAKYIRIIRQPLWLILWCAALIGLAGYLNLAWTITGYWVLLISLLLVWLLLRELINNFDIILKNYAMTHTTFGVFWAQEIITPLILGLRIFLILGSCFLLLTLSGLGNLIADKIGWESLLATASVILLSNLILLILAGVWVERLHSTLGSTIIQYGRWPGCLILTSVAFHFSLPWLHLNTVWHSSLQQFLVIAQIGGSAWLTDRLMAMFEEIVARRYLLNADDNIKSRRVQTQAQMLRRIATIVVYLVAIAAILMTFPQARKIGTGLLASAGVAGLVAGVAARQILENLIAGIQIGLTQPIRLGDVVVVEGEWGRIAEIRSTYVVVELWDKRHLVLPINYFITNSFENWTRTDSDLLGTVSFYVDYTFPVAAGRRELQKILHNSSLWDGQTWGLDVTNTSPHTMELRALMSAADAASIWNLRCVVRERFLAFLQREYPSCLPKKRHEWA